MTIRELYRYFDEKYPRSLACDWDNDGLMCTLDGEAAVSGVTVALDATENAIAHTAEMGHNVLITHHPLIFRGVKELAGNGVISRRALCAMRSGVSVMSFHTRLDSAFGGVNDALAARLGVLSCVVFGNSEAMQIGRCGELASQCSLADFSQFVERSLGAKARVYVARDHVKRVALVGGSGGDFLNEAKEAGADTFVVGEISYHTALDAADDGINVIEVGHYESEFPICDVLCSEVRAIGVDKADVFCR